MMKIGESPRVVCSICGSGDVVRPVNDSNIDMQCQRCGHAKMKNDYLKPWDSGVKAYIGKRSDTVEF